MIKIRINNLFNTKNIACALALSISLASNASANSINIPQEKTNFSNTIRNFDYYIGVDAQRRNMHYHKNLGSNIMKKNIPEANIFVGVKFNEHWGLELGYEFSEKVSSSARAYEGDTILGDFLPATGDPDISQYKDHHVKYKRNGFNIGVVANTPTYKDCISFFAAVGVSYDTLKYRHNAQTTTITTIIPGLQDINVDSEQEQYINKKFFNILAKTGITLKKKESNFGVRFFISLSKNTPKVTNSAKNISMHIQNNMQYGIGLFYYL